MAYVTPAPLRPFLRGIRRAYKPERIIRAFAPVRFVDRASQVLKLLDRPVPVDLICLTPAEYERKAKEHGVIRVAVREGVLLTAA